MAVSVDGDVRQAGMFGRWPTPNVEYISDPGGERFLQPLQLFDPQERDGIALPGMLVIAADGSDVYRYQGRDFADRTTDEDVYAALDALGLDAIEPPEGGPVADVPDDLRGFFRPTDFAAFFRGNKFGAMAIQGRSSDPVARATAKEHRIMADATLAAWAEVR